MTQPDIVIPEDLVAWTTQQLKEKGHKDPEFWKNRLNIMPETMPGEPMMELMQIFRINRALRYLLGEQKDNTFDLRLMIVDTHEVNVWKEFMANQVLPRIAEKQYT